MMAAMGAQQTTPAAGPAGAAVASAGIPELLGVGEVAVALGVSETDVLATLEAGDLKGKKIGSTWRVTRAALDEFLKS
jgi:excisionase family DNA binding protein